METATQATQITGIITGIIGVGAIIQASLLRTNSINRSQAKPKIRRCLWLAGISLALAAAAITASINLAGNPHQTGQTTTGGAVSSHHQDPRPAASRTGSDPQFGARCSIPQRCRKSTISRPQNPPAEREKRKRPIYYRNFFFSSPTQKHVIHVIPLIIII